MDRASIEYLKELLTLDEKHKKTRKLLVLERLFDKKDDKIDEN